jgi:hypothetical protein
MGPRSPTGPMPASLAPLLAWLFSKVHPEKQPPGLRADGSSSLGEPPLPAPFGIPKWRYRFSLKTEQLSDNPKSAFDLGVGAPLSPRKKRRWHRLLRKEVIQPHLPIRLPCYDFTPLTGHTFGRSFLAVRPRTSGAADSGGVTGGVYKARERIHRSTADLRLLAIPPSCSRVADCNPHYGCLFGIRSASRPRFPLSHPL